MVAKAMYMMSARVPHKPYRRGYSLDDREIKFGATTNSTP